MCMIKEQCFSFLILVKKSSKSTISCHVQISISFRINNKESIKCVIISKKSTFPYESHKSIENMTITFLFF